MELPAGNYSLERVSSSLQNKQIYFDGQKKATFEIQSVSHVTNLQFTFHSISC